jgi:hypothetical protein
MRGMTALASREHCNGCTHDRLCLCVGVQILQREQCGFEGMPEALGHGVVPTVARPAPPGLPPVPAQELPKALSALRTPTSRLHHEACCRLPLPDRPCPGLGHELCPPRAGHRPPDHGARTQSQPYGEL